MAKGKILVVEDEADIRDLLQFNLKKEGFDVLLTADGEEGLAAAKRFHPEILLLDIMLPGMDGYDLCKAIRKELGDSVGIIMLTARNAESDIVTGLAVGADDFIVKPFSPRVLLARVKTLQRRLKKGDDRSEARPLSRHGLELDPQRHRVILQGQEINLTAGEFKLLYLLVQRAGIVFSRAQIVDAVRGVDYPVTERAVDVQIVGLRRKLGEYGDYIETVRGVGYRFREQ
jgi:two-component system phosphate regulon response regulator PhoB